jgi:uncharacterized membrane-anchored protein YhcB (DUF1043 family)
VDANTIAVGSIVANVVLAIILALVKRMLDSNEKRIDAQEKNIDDHRKELWQLRELLPQHYVRRDDHLKLVDDMFQMLRRIEEKLDKKVDKV